MAVSSTNTFNPDIIETIEEAYELAGAEMRTGYQLRSAMRSLDLLMAEWANRGYNMWTIQQATQSVTAGQITYNLSAAVVDILEMVVVVEDNDYPLTRLSATDYFSKVNKTSQGRPTSYWLKRDLTPVLYVWQAPDQTYTLKYWYLRRIYDAGTGANTNDVPFRFLPALIAGLAHKLAAKTAGQEQRVPFLEAEYEKQWRLATEADRERTPLYIRARGRR